MSTITREQLRERALEKVKGLEFSITQAAFADSRSELEEELELARIALASLEAEAVGFIVRHKGTGKFGSWLHPKADWFKSDEYEVLKAYTAPPAPVSMKDHQIRELVNELRDIAVEYHGTQQLRERIARTVRAAMLQGAENAESRCTIQAAPALDSSPKIAESRCSNPQVIPDCSCRTCRPVTFTDSRFVVCPECGNKRCPHANDHRNACTGSNEPGQEGSAYPAAPQQEA